MAKRIKQVAFGMTNFVRRRVRALLYVGNADWSKLATASSEPPKSKAP